MPFKSKATRKAWMVKNPNKLREYENRATARAKSILIGMLGDKCARCGISDQRVLQIDHVNGDGAAERKSGVRGTRRLLAHIRKRGTSGYQMLCANCNWIKRIENNETGHAIQK